MLNLIFSLYGYDRECFIYGFWVLYLVIIMYYWCVLLCRNYHISIKNAKCLCFVYFTIQKQISLHKFVKRNPRLKSLNEYNVLNWLKHGLITQKWCKGRAKVIKVNVVTSDLHRSSEERNVIPRMQSYVTKLKVCNLLLFLESSCDDLCDTYS